MEQIIRNLWLGSDRDVAEAKRRGYARLACCKDGIDSHRSMLGYESLGAPKGDEYLFARRGNVMALNLVDHENPDMVPVKVLKAGIKFIHEFVSEGKPVFVHCNAGKSRSATIVMLYLRAIKELPESFVRSEHVFRTLYPEYQPGAGMRTHARMLWKDIKI